MNRYIHRIDVEYWKTRKSNCDMKEDLVKSESTSEEFASNRFFKGKDESGEKKRRKKTDEHGRERTKLTRED